MSTTLALAMDLIRRRSVSPQDDGCQALLAARLDALGFRVEHLPFGAVQNTWARRGEARPLLVLAGHTDVVPSGPVGQWDTPPFEPVVRDGQLYGRGSADMKGGLAAMVAACERFLTEHPRHRGSIAFLLTSDEEGPAVDGTVRVIQCLQQRHETIDWCLIGEPTSEHQLGDVIKNGRRGSLTGHLRVRGVQGHVAYPQRADNPVHRVAPVLLDLIDRQWDEGNEFFPPTSFQVSNVRAGTGADNVIPGEIEVQFNFRYSTEQTAADLRRQVEERLQREGLRYGLDWLVPSEPFLTNGGTLVEVVCEAVEQVAGLSPRLSTAGGTSDGRFVSPTGAQVVELGPVNATIHKVNECVGVAELETLTRIYERVLVKLLGH
jgi:succinyl-diaminopimelate desuccinylase